MSYLPQELQANLGPDDFGRKDWLMAVARYMANEIKIETITSSPAAGEVELNFDDTYIVFDGASLDISNTDYILPSYSASAGKRYIFIAMDDAMFSNNTLQVIVKSGNATTRDGVLGVDTNIASALNPGAAQTFLCTKLGWCSLWN